MVVRRIAAGVLDFGVIRTEFQLSEEYPAEAVAEATAAVDAHAGEREDRTDLPFVTIDPPSSMDLDQAVHIERTAAGGFIVHYAIADVGAVVVPGSVLDKETRRRGQTFYLPDGSLPLHPRELSEGSASLLPDQTRPVALWTIELDATAAVTQFSVRRALVKSIARLDYAGVQADADAGTLHPSIADLPAFGALRAAAALQRGSIELKLPEQEVVPADEQKSTWRLELQPRTAADDWNAEVSLLTGMCAAQLMIEARIGLLRTLPPPDPEAEVAMRKTAGALGLDWPTTTSVGVFLAELPANAPDTLVMMTAATTLLRGADYAAFDGTLPDLLEHSGIGAPYAHVTAPLRRLSDRFATEVCLAVSAKTDVPAWARDALPELSEIMRGSDSLANKVERACIDLTEAFVLAPRVGQKFSAVVVKSADGKRDSEIFVNDPPVLAKCTGAPPEGQVVSVQLTTADITKRAVAFAYSK
ncbi:RNB domain-containing ribonuclease [Antrihabitans cavernicola]|uniref:RNB domain-containing ribonuclease n=1 Tax=Antrihabitans cavernicola TaxID=2495913 RepID=A0A5A7SEJ8_9NOCA|nr:RNB domain-containing ribonuclease [Spelaeibacter cavernicola]KAA0023063.1 RNB domain-containing ribonuclease [Spelaeibacter cavernicola]